MLNYIYIYITPKLALSKRDREKKLSKTLIHICTFDIFALSTIRIKKTIFLVTQYHVVAEKWN